MAVSTLLATFLCTMVLPVLLILVALRLWEVYMVRGRDPGCPSPLPPGSMGLPFLGETLQLILQVNTQRSSATPGRFHLACFCFLTLLKTVLVRRRSELTFARQLAKQPELIVPLRLRREPRTCHANR